MYINRLKLLGCAVLLVGTGVMPAVSETTSMRFNVSLGIAKLGEMHVSAEVNGDSYSTDGRLFTSGLAGAMYNLNYESSSQGSVSENGGFLPNMYTSTSNEQGRKSSAEIQFDEGQVVSVVFNPTKNIPDDALGQSDVIDPMTLIYLLIRPVPADQACVGSFDLFDGKNRSSVSFTGLRQLNNGRIECSVSYSGGKDGGIAISGLTFTPNGDGNAYISKFSVDTAVGTLVARVK